MKRFIRTTGMYLAKTLVRAKFWLAVALYMGLLVLISQDLISPNATVYYILHYAFANSTSYFLLVICALPNAAVFAEEWSTKRFVASYARAKKDPFAASMIVSSFLSAFGVSMIASVLYMTLLSFKFPLFGDVSAFYRIWEVTRTEVLQSRVIISCIILWNLLPKAALWDCFRRSPRYCR